MAVLGIGPKITPLGLLNPAKFSLQNDITDSSVSILSADSSMKAMGTSPHFSSYLATTAAYATLGIR